MTEYQALRAHLVEWHGIGSTRSGSHLMRRHYNLHHNPFGQAKPKGKPHSHPPMSGPTTVIDIVDPVS